MIFGLNFSVVRRKSVQILQHSKRRKQSGCFAEIRLLRQIGEAVVVFLVFSAQNVSLSDEWKLTEMDVRSDIFYFLLFLPLTDQLFTDKYTLGGWEPFHVQ